MTKPLFQKRHYEFLANHIRESKVLSEGPFGVDLVTRMAQELKKDNPKFNLIKFWDKCNGKH